MVLGRGPGTVCAPRTVASLQHPDGACGVWQRRAAGSKLVGRKEWTGEVEAPQKSWGKLPYLPWGFCCPPEPLSTPAPGLPEPPHRSLLAGRAPGPAHSSRKVPRGREATPGFRGTAISASVLEPQFSSLSDRANAILSESDRDEVR